MDERRLEIFTAVARRLSFSDAARGLHLSQPAVSQQVAALEAELGVRLLDRSRRRIRLTAAGAALLPRAESLLRVHADARRAVAAAEGRVAGELAVAASLTVGAYVLPPVLAELARRHPELRVRVTIENTEQVLAALLAGRADLGFVEGEQQAEGIELHSLREDELVVIAPREHRFAAADAVALDDLAAEPFVVREPGSGTRKVAESHLRAAGLAPDALRVVAELSGIEAIKSAVAAGMGISIVSRSAVRPGDGLAALRVAGVPMTRQLAAATLAGSEPLPAAVRLVELVRSSAGRAGVQPVSP